MPHELYVNATRELTYELWFRNRDKSETKPTVASGTFTLINARGDVIVTLTTINISNGNRGTFLLRPTSGSATAGAYQEIWDFFVNSTSNTESFQKVEFLYIKDRA